MNGDRCPASGLPCPASPCIGEADPKFCGFLAALTAWNETPAEAKDAYWAGVAPATGPSAALLASVARCSERGSVLPVSLQPECGCGGELSECRAGKGTVPGRVTLRDCLDCRRAATGLN